jgi:hypothetical protein
MLGSPRGRLEAVKGYREIKRILVEDLGFRDLDAYKKWIETARPTTSLTRERIESLSPDVVDCRAFWKACDELFGTDPVCNVAIAPEVGRLPYSIDSQMDANRMNLRLAKSLGVTAFLEENSHARLKVLELGAGYGSLKSFIETHTNHMYTGVDVVPRVAGVVETTPDGLLPRSLVDREQARYSYVVSSNVFQHFSARQRQHAIADSHTVLHDGGLFIFNLTVDTPKLPPYMRDEGGAAWADHYGQYTPIPRGDVVYEELANKFRILYVTQRYDGLFNFVCQKI